MNINFTSGLIRSLALYLDIALSDIAKEPEFPHTRITLYKMCDNKAPVNIKVNKFFNDFWNKRGLTPDDLQNIYQLQDLVLEGSMKEREYRLKKHKEGLHNG